MVQDFDSAHTQTEYEQMSSTKDFVNQIIMLVFGHKLLYWVPEPKTNCVLLIQDYLYLDIIDGLIKRSLTNFHRRKSKQYNSGSPPIFCFDDVNIKITTNMPVKDCKDSS